MGIEYKGHVGVQRSNGNSIQKLSLSAKIKQRGESVMVKERLVKDSICTCICTCTQ